MENIGINFFLSDVLNYDFFAVNAFIGVIIRVIKKCYVAFFIDFK